ncbi:MAG TPA: PIG-L family deacetylase [Polyangiaceae bacterium]
MLVWIFAQSALLASSWALGARWLREDARLAERASAACLLALATPIGVVALLSAGSWLRPAPLVIASAMVALAGLLAAGRAGRTAARADAARAVLLLLETARTTAVLPLVVGCVALGLATWAALLLPFWAWDSLGYHLPVVWDALDVGHLRRVPTHGWYINVYPRAGEMYFVWCRALLGHDRYLDLAQTPFAIAACVAAASLARRASAAAPRAIGYAAAYLAVPVVALQIPTGYVDLIYACFLILAALFATGQLEPRRAALFGMAAGLLLATKPTAPPTVVLLMLTFGVRCLRARRLPLALLAAALVACGSWSYIRNLIEFGNPLWPITISLGPLHFQGLEPVGPMLVRGLPEELNRGWAYRVFVSLIADPAQYVYDMRYGGFWPLVPFLLLPLGLVSLRSRDVRKNALGPLLVAACALASPMAQWLRFSLALPAALLALSAAEVSRHPRWRQRLFDLALAAAAAIGVLRAYPGFTAGARTLMAIARGGYFGGIDGHEGEWDSIKARLAPGEAFAYDRSFATPGRAYRADGATRVVYLDDEHVRPGDLPAWIARERVRLLAVANTGPLRDRIVSDRAHFAPVMSCPLDPCHVYEVRRAPGDAPVNVTQQSDVLVVVPHPDDETLIAAGVLARAVATGQRAHVVIVTNGDYACIVDGLARQAESVAALAVLGIREDQLDFLGYPDGYLAHLGRAPLPGVKRLVSGRCERGNTTYGQRGRGSRDFHRMRFGEPGAYTAESVVQDLAAIVAELRPRDVFVTHPHDTHPDHATTYALLRRALDRQPEAPRLHRALVHTAGCWPTGTALRDPCPEAIFDPRAALPPLPPPLTAYVPREARQVPQEMLASDPRVNRKALALLEYQTQLGPGGLKSYLAGFIRRAETFYPEELTLASPARWVRRAAGARTRVEVLSSGEADYVLELSRAELELKLWRTKSDSKRVLGSWRLPHDAGNQEHLEIAIEPRAEDGGITEITLWRARALLGVAIDPEPLTHGERVRIVGAAPGTELVLHAAKR